MRWGRPLALATLAVAALSAIPAPAAAPGPRQALSIGWPNAGRLENGRRVRNGAWMRVLPRYAKSPAKWAMPQLLDALDRAAHKVARRWPGAVLGVGELSAQGGGPIASHHSHQSGRDADVSFYLTDARGRQLRHDRFLACDPDGKVRGMPGARFDDARNWALLAALLDDRAVRVRQIFVHASLRARLLAHAAKVHAPAALRERAAFVLYQPPNVDPHDDHFHLRVACPPSQAGKGCIDDARARKASPETTAARAPSRPSDPPEPSATEPDPEGDGEPE